MVNIRTYKQEDYPIVLEWWKAHQWDGVPMQVLPPLGAIAETGKHDICAAWLYLFAGQGICLMEWLVSNPEATGFEVRRGIKAITEYFEEVMTELNYNVMLTCCRQDSVKRAFQGEGFTVTDTGVTHMIKTIPLKQEATG